MKALAFGENDAFLSPVSALLSRAGFQVDVISTVKSLQKHCHIHHFIFAESSDALISLANEHARLSYDFIACCDESALLRTVSSSFSVDEKIRLLPVMHQNNFFHLGSKINLSVLLKENNIKTPDFFVANHFSEMIFNSENLGFPLFIKIDASSGGDGVFECNSINDVKKLTNIIRYPVLIQKKILGRVITSEALFINKKPIFIEIAEAISFSKSHLGPSAVKKYLRPTERDLPIYEHTKVLGNVLGANGFINLTWIESADGTIFFIEADMRPNVWIEYGKYFQEDPAKKIKRYFETGESLTKDAFVNSGADVILSYAPRLSYFDVLLNKYRCRFHVENYYSRSYLLQRTYHLLLAIKKRLLNYALK